MQYFGDILIKELALNNMSQRTLAEKIGVSEVTISRYTNSARQPKSDILQKIALALNVSTDHLLGITSKRNTNIFADRLRLLRESKNISQSNLADLLGIVRTAISNYETNRAMPDSQTLVALSHIFNVSIDYLLGNSIDESVAYTDNGIEEAIKEHFSQTSNEDREKIFMLVSKLYWQYKDI